VTLALLVLSATAIFGTLIFWLQADTIDDYGGDWHRTGEVWTSRSGLQNVQTVCLCPTYECGATDYTAVVTFENITNGQSLLAIRDPYTVTGDSIRRVSGKPYCIEKSDGEHVEFRLIERGPKDLWLEIW